jgi:hypothetical protein
VNLVADFVVTVMLLATWALAIENLRSHPALVAAHDRLGLPPKSTFVAGVMEAVLGLGLLLSLMIGNSRGVLVTCTSSVMVALFLVGVIAHVRAHDAPRRFWLTAVMLVGSVTIFALTF